MKSTGTGTLALTDASNALSVLDIHGGTVSVAGTTYLNNSTPCPINFSAPSGTPELLGAGTLAVGAVTFGGALVGGSIVNSGATTLASVALATQTLVTNSTGGTTITTLPTDATGILSNADALLLSAATGSNPITKAGIGTMTINSTIASTGGLAASLGGVTLGANGVLPTGTIAISGSAILTLAASGLEDAIPADANFTGTSHLVIPASVTAASIAGQADFVSGTVAVHSDTAGVNLLDTGGTFKFHYGSKISLAPGANWGSPITITA